MRNYSDYEQDQENAEFGRWLIETVAGFYGLEPRLDLIEKAVFKYTDCGAWVKFDEKGIVVGTIVEGSDAEVSQRVDVGGLMDLEDSDAKKLLKARFFGALHSCEVFADEHFHESQ